MVAGYNYIERPLLGDSLKTFRKSSSSWSTRKTIVIILFGCLFCGLLAGNLYQNFLLESSRPMIRLRARKNDLDVHNAAHNGSFFDFQPDKDVIVFLQIQNAGANFFEKHLTEDLAEPPCFCSQKSRKQCRCTVPGTKTPWLFSRLSSGWRCGVHPDWTQLNGCVDRVLDEMHGQPMKRRYLYMTIIRDPVRRFRSEWLHYVEERGSRPSRHLCGGHEYSLADVQNCFKERLPATVSLSEFAECEDNLATNRQTRMLADLQLVNCYDPHMNKTERNMILLHSAMRNLQRMAFFGLAEFPNVSQRIFEATFGLRFTSNPHRRFNKLSNYLKNAKRFSVHEDSVVRGANHLDVQLYEFAKELLFERFHKMFKERVHEKSAEDSEWADGEDLFLDR